MIHSFFALEAGAPILALMTHPATALWASGWVAAALGWWLRTVLPPPDDDEIMIALAMAGGIM